MMRQMILEVAMRQFLAAILILLPVGHIGYVQTAYVQQFYAADLRLTPGKVILSTGNPVVLEFYGAVNTVIAGQPNPLVIDQLTTALVLITDQRSGTVPLMVEVGGNFLLFEVEIDNRDQRSRVYRVVERRERSFSPSTAILPAPRTVPQATTGEGGGDLNLIPGEGVIYFSYTNTTSKRIALDPSRLNVSRDGVEVRFEVIKSPLSNLVGPGEQQTGIIRLEQRGHFDIAWSVVTLSDQGGTTVTLGGSADVD
jgi:hypothetical protein